MSSSVAVLRGKQTPRIELRPDPELWSHADDAAFLASSYGLSPDPWQHLVLDAWLAELVDGRWASGRCGLAVPRQNGKNGVIEVRELYGMVALGERFLHTAHEVKTARKAFLRLCSFFENDDFPELKALVKEIRRTNGQEAIVLTNGASVEFVARSRGSGRGFTVDVLVMDEAQELTDEQLEALLPTISAAPTGNPQIILTGTPPGPGSIGEVFTRTRQAGVDGEDGRLSWHEWSIDGTVDPTDRNLWADTNPALGIRLNVTTLEDELATLSEEGFLRERLGLWADRRTASVIPLEAWERQAIPEPPTDGRLAYGLDMTPDRAMVALSVALRPEVGPVHVEVARHESTMRGTRWAVDWLVERWPKATAVVVDAQSPAMALVPELLERGVKVTISNASDMAKACGMIHDGVIAGDVTHFDQARLTDALVGATKRDIGQAGGWGWNRRSNDVDLSPLVSVTLALWGVMTSKRRPGRKAKVMVL